MNGLLTISKPLRHHRLEPMAPPTTLAIMDGDVYCKIVGLRERHDSPVGENIYPREIEECPLFVSEHQRIQVFGIPD